MERDPIVNNGGYIRLGVPMLAALLVTTTGRTSHVKSVDGTAGRCEMLNAELSFRRSFSNG